MILMCKVLCTLRALHTINEAKTAGGRQAVKEGVHSEERSGGRENGRARRDACVRENGESEVGRSGKSAPGRSGREKVDSQARPFCRMPEQRRT